MTGRAVQRMLSLFESGALVRPDAAKPNTVDLARALFASAGTPAFEAEAGATRIGRFIAPSEHIVFVLADGLGMHLVQRLPQDSFLRRHLKLELDAVFPSSTAPALTSLATGLWPAAHALPTWFTFLPRHSLTATVLPYTDRATRTGLARLGIEASSVFLASVAARFHRRDFKALHPIEIANSVYTRYVTGGPPAEAYQTLAGAVDLTCARIRKAKASTYTYIYYPVIDSNEHEFGAQSHQAWREVLRFDAEIARLKETVGPAASIVVSADHGQITVPDQMKTVLNDGDELQEMLRVWPPAGEPRCICFHVRPGRRQAFAETFQRRFQEAYVLLSADEAESLRLFGPGILSPDARARIGDFIALPESAQAMGYAGEAPIVRMRGFHGGLAPDEMRIPLVIA